MPQDSLADNTDLSQPPTQDELVYDEAIRLTQKLAEEGRAEQHEVEQIKASKAHYIQNKKHQQLVEKAKNKAKRYKLTQLEIDQQSLSHLFGTQVFRYIPNDMQQKNIHRLASIADGILYGNRSSQIPKVAWEQLSPWQKHKFHIAAQLHVILNQNEFSSHRDDAKAFAESLKVIIDVDKDHNGNVNKEAFIQDLRFFAIDYENPIPGTSASNAAYNLLGGPRLGAIGWKQKYWDQDNNPTENQAHHFSYFLTIALEHPDPAHLEFSKFGATIIDLWNKNDQNLGYLAIDYGRLLSEKSISWDQFPNLVYQELRQ